MEDVPVDRQIDDLFAAVDLDFASSAVTNRKIYQAHVNEGFTPDQAMDVVKCFLSTHLQTKMIIDHQEAHPDGTA